MLVWIGLNDDASIGLHGQTDRDRQRLREPERLKHGWKRPSQTLWLGIPATDKRQKEIETDSQRDREANKTSRHALCKPNIHLGYV